MSPIRMLRKKGITLYRNLKMVSFCVFFSMFGYKCGSNSKLFLNTTNKKIKEIGSTPTKKKTEKHTRLRNRKKEKSISYEY